MRLRGRLLALCLVLGSAAAFAQATPPVTLSADMLNAAIAAAKAPAPPAPYALKGPSKPVTRNAPLDPEVAKTLDPNKILTFGAVYTPFIRAAMLARKADDAGKPFSAADIPAEIQDGLTYVAALPWERTDVSGPDRLVDTIFVIVTPPGSTDRAQIVQPVWVKPETTRVAEHSGTRGARARHARGVRARLDSGGQGNRDRVRRDGLRAAGGDPSGGHCVVAIDRRTA